MADEKYKCGESATEVLVENSEYTRDGYKISVHKTEVEGVGTITSCKAYDSNYTEWHVTIKNGITVLGDKCYAKSGMAAIDLPETLIIIGNECFRYSRIKSIVLPEGLIQIGNNNFSSSLVSLHIPSTLSQFPINNILDCSNLYAISVHENNPSYCSYEGMLFTRDMSTLLFCPRQKEGVVVVPEGVKTLGMKCFENCKKITRLQLPTTLEFIGDYALSNTEHSQLVIPNSVSALGKGAFYGLRVTSKFKMSNRVTELPNDCFHYAALCDYSFISRMKSIGDNCFYQPYDKNKVLPMHSHLKLLELQHLGEYAFYNRKEIESVEFSNKLVSLHPDAFKSMKWDAKIRIHSIVPKSIGTNTLNVEWGMTLVVPIGCKSVYKNSVPWTQFSNIVEMETERDALDGVVTKDTTLLRYRLESIASSVQTINLEYLQSLMQNLILDYQEIVSDEEYEEAKQLIFYNRRFNPVLILDMELQIISNWPERYKLLLLNEMMKHPMSPFQIVAPSTYTKETKLLDISQPLKQSSLISSVNTSGANFVLDAEVYFENLLTLLKSELTATSKTLDVAVSWFTNHSLFCLIGDLADKGVQIRLLINNDSVNNGGYCLDFNKLIEKGIRMSLVEYPHMIHHKFCIIDGQTIINGSYNWTRFSEKNYENLMIFRQHPNLVNSFTDEFEKLWQNAEHKDINKMPEAVSARPEYDRNAFRQYITEELDAQIREVSEHRDKITVLEKALTLNKDYLKKISPTLFQEYEEVERNNDSKTIQEIDNITYSAAIEERERETEYLIKENRILIDRVKELNQEHKDIEQGTVKSSESKQAIETEIENIHRQIESNQEQIENRIAEIDSIELSSKIETLGGVGALKINLKWNTYDDLDLHVIDPEDQEICYSKKNATCQGVMGQLDIDANAGGHKSNTPQENIYWEGKAPLGNYKVDVVYFSKKDNVERVDFVVTIYSDNGNAKVYTGSLKQPKEKVCIAKFNISENGISYIEENQSSQS